MKKIKSASMKETRRSRKRERKHIAWFTKELEMLILEKHKRQQLYWLQGLLSDFKLIKSLSNNITHLKRKLKKAFYKGKIQEYEGEPRKMWKVLKEVLEERVPITDKILPGDDKLKFGRKVILPSSFVGI